MIYLIGGAPRTGKSILGQQVATHLRTSWISTDLLHELLRVKNVPGVVTEWNASPKHIASTAEWFYPCLERFVSGVHYMAENYVIEGVTILPTQVAQLTKNYPIRFIFLGCSAMTLARFDAFPGRSPAYGQLPLEMRQQFAHDIPQWSEFIKQEAARFGYPYVDMKDNFEMRLQEAEAILTAVL